MNRNSNRNIQKIILFRSTEKSEREYLDQQQTIFTAEKKKPSSKINGRFVNSEIRSKLLAILSLRGRGRMRGERMGFLGQRKIEIVDSKIGEEQRKIKEGGDGEYSETAGLTAGVGGGSINGSDFATLLSLLKSTVWFLFQRLVRTT